MDFTTMVRILLHSIVQMFVFDEYSAQPRIDESTLLAVQHQVAQQAALAQIPDAVKRVSSSHFEVIETALIILHSSLYISIKPSSITTFQRSP